MKKLISMLLVMVLMVTIPVQTFAYSKSEQYETKTSTSSFIDAEGKENTIVMTILGRGRIHSEHFIDGQLLNKVDASSVDGENINLTITDANAESKQMKLKASSTLVNEKEYNSIARVITPQAYSYQGRINYKTCYDSFGNAYNYRLSIYQQTGSAYNTYKTINETAGTYLNVAVSVLGSILAIICPALVVVSSSLMAAAIYAAGVSVVGGILQGAVSQRYFVSTTPYSVRATDPATSRSNSYSGEVYKVYLGQNYMSGNYYEGYVPWNSNSVASMMFGDFWDANLYPGVLSYS